eukprot:Sspe_Gene.25873::Locus_10504_Transcript_1_1_Confidence_1.000_Length_2538::g.25873::m.25873/K04909/KCNH6; potassium voltage-gated channel Eag-related subfamily H member 6
MDGPSGLVSRGFTEAETAKLETLFNILDEDNVGTIRVEQLGILMPRMGVFLDDDELQSLFDSVDSDGSGGIDFHEFLELMARHREANQLALLEGTRESFLQTKASLVIHGALRPDDPFVWFWDLLMLGVTLYYIIIVPLEDVSTFRASLATKVIAAILLALDIVKNCFTVEVDKDNADLKHVVPRAIAISYFKKIDAVIDVLAALPIDLLIEASGLDGTRYQYLRLLKIYKIRSVFTLSARDLISPLYTQIHFSMVPLLKIAFWATASVHILSIVWIALSPGNVPYIDAVYFVMYTLTTTGFGDVEVVNRNQKAFAIFLFGCSTVVTGLVVGKLVQFSQQADLKTDAHKRMLETLAALNHLSIPSDFKQEVLGFQYHRLQHSNSLFNETIGGLPQVMQDRMALYGRMKIVRQVPIFSQAEEICLAKLAQSLITVVVPPEEYIVIAGEEGEEMFFLFHGICAVWLPDGTWVATVKRGGVFGEVALLESTRRAASIKTLTYCHLFRLDKQAFESIVQQFPSLRDSIAAVSKQRKIPPKKSVSFSETASSSSGSGNNYVVNLKTDDLMIPVNVNETDSPPILPDKEEGYRRRSSRVQGYMLRSGTILTKSSEHSNTSSRPGSRGSHLSPSPRATRGQNLIFELLTIKLDTIHSRLTQLEEKVDNINSARSPSPVATPKSLSPSIPCYGSTTSSGSGKVRKSPAGNSLLLVGRHIMKANRLRRKDGKSADGQPANAKAVWS